MIIKLFGDDGTVWEGCCWHGLLYPDEGWVIAKFSCLQCTVYFRSTMYYVCMYCSLGVYLLLLADITPYYR